MTKLMFARKWMELLTSAGNFACGGTSLTGQRYARSFATHAGRICETTGQEQRPPPSDPEVVHSQLQQRLVKLFEDETKRGLIIPAFKRALVYGEKSAVRDNTGDYSFIQIYESVKRLALQISNCCGSASQSRVAYLCPNNVTYLISQWACWFSGQIGVPLSPKYPQEALEYFLKDSDASLLIATPEFQKVVQPLVTKLDIKLILVHHDLLKSEPKQQNEQQQDEISHLDPRRENLIQLNDTLLVEGCLNGEFYRDANALILYTSGTTGKPKGVVLSYSNLDAQYDALLHAWQITSGDSVLHALPLNHVHGTINALNMPLAAGSKCVMLPKFDSSSVWSYLLNVNMTTKERVNIFMGVPTMYNLLIQEYDSVFGKNARMCDYVKTHCKNKIRLMISGSAPLPGTTFNRWHQITGHNLLERYGMTETGMAISNSYIQDSTRARVRSSVGLPLPGVIVKIVDNERKKEVILEGIRNEGFWNQTPNSVVLNSSCNQSIAGGLYIKGRSVFQQYWQKPEETSKEFEDGWFKTGDTAEYVDGIIKILGRSSVDMIKSGGYRISALEIETVLLEHPEIKDVAVVGLPDETWGSKVVALVSVKDDKAFDIPQLLIWLENKIPKHGMPREIKLISEVPRNAMGKVNKVELIKTLQKEKQNEEKVVK
ncbi:malonate--CoA ligase ACSF3, mitochondrial [Wyeomyia smithii]|uniref:malonate--CoA ligase ACSF3, mitochondrial n=1 Tax=Wyeomyia smithii TaxID=174621 RepID=UPI002467BCAD|nr:malonate--CoA ligase ACSF3, mitochondrial [Wyeomyia smithii]